MRQHPHHRRPHYLSRQHHQHYLDPKFLNRQQLLIHQDFHHLIHLKRLMRHFYFRHRHRLLRFV